jgi:hypothetical protein
MQFRAQFRQPNTGERGDQNGGSARTYLTLSTLATVLQSWDDHPHRRLTMLFQHGFLSLRWPFSAMAVLPGPLALRG